MCVCSRAKYWPDKQKLHRRIPSGKMPLSVEDGLICIRLYPLTIDPFLTVHQSEGLDTVQLSQRYEVRNYHTFHYRRKWKYPDSRYNTIRKIIIGLLMYFHYIWWWFIYLTASELTYWSYQCHHSRQHSFWGALLPVRYICNNVYVLDMYSLQSTFIYYRVPRQEDHEIKECATSSLLSKKK